MSRRFGRSVAAVARTTLISGFGALGWLALSAGAASADERSEQGLLGPVSSVVTSGPSSAQSVVEHAVAPLTTVASPGVSAPSSNQVGHLPRVTEIASSVPAVVSEGSVVHTAAPVSGVVGSTLSQVPVVSDVVPADSITSFTQPLLETVDTAIAPVVPPVAGVLEPVTDLVDPVLDVVDPVVEVANPIVDHILDPVTDVVDPVIDPAGPITDVIDPVDPITDVIDPVDPVIDPVDPVDPAPEPVDVIQAPAPTDPSEPGTVGGVISIGDDAQDGVTESATSGSVSSRLDAALTDDTQKSAVAPKTPKTVLTEVRFADDYRVYVSATGNAHRVAEAPGLAFMDGKATVLVFDSSAGDAGMGASSSGFTGSGGSGAAEALSSYDLVPSLVGSLQYGSSAVLPLNPTFDPGSTPD